jgi:uncharacterized iron-regulated membrane protein
MGQFIVKVFVLIIFIMLLGLVMWPLRIALAFSGLPHWADSLIVALVAIAFVLGVLKYFGVIDLGPPPQD